MCGICGIVTADRGVALDRDIVGRMTDTLHHRGPDDGDVMVDAAAGVGLGHRRLSIIDLSPAGRQPMRNEDGSVWIVYNGEVYNHAELARELKARGHVYRSATDSETILHLYEEEGPACVERLEGMFAFAIWDARRGELFLARDRLGVKPLYVATVPGAVLFASEVKALLTHPAVRPAVDTEAFHDYLTFGFVPPPRTMYANVTKLAPAERMTVRADGLTHRERWWSPLSRSLAEEAATLSDREAIDRTRELLRESIAKRMMSEVPFGVFLSGGLDSSANVALMAELMSQPVRTFSTAPRGHDRYDELSYARVVAERFGADHREVVIDDDDAKRFLPALATHQDEPIADWTALPQHFVAELARANGTVVVQCGEGSDEIFHGYDGYVFHRRYAVPFQRLPRPLRRGLGVAASRVTRRLGRGIRHGEALYDAGFTDQPYWGGALCFRGELKQQVLSRRFARDSYEVVSQSWGEAGRLLPGADVFQRMTYLELQQRLPELLLMRLDKLCMANSVEGREPFLDHHLVQFALALPPRLKYRDGVGKWVLREAMRGLLPDAIIDRPKQGFGTPMEEWLREDFGRSAEEVVMRSTLREQGLLDYGTIGRIFAAHRSGRGDFSKHIWNLFTISAWHDRWIAEEPVTAAPDAASAIV